MRSFYRKKLTASLLNISYLSSPFISSDIFLSAYSDCVELVCTLLFKLWRVEEKPGHCLTTLLA